MSDAVATRATPDVRSFALPPGDAVSRYQIVRGLARGGMGEVYLARMPVAGGHKLVALKRMLPQHMDDPEVRAMFLSEAAVALRLDHSGIVTVLDVVDEAGEHAIVMEYVHGRSARDVLRAWADGAPRSLGTALAIAAGAAAALHYVHEARDDEG
ncbi:MAG: protein kinase, partial [Myxococcota bacterium]